MPRDLFAESNVNPVGAVKQPRDLLAGLNTAQSQPDLGEEIGRGLAVNARGVATGAAGFFDLPFTIPTKIQEGVATGLDKLTGGNVAEKVKKANETIVLPSEKIGQLIDDFNQGRATPRNDFEQGIQRTAEFLGGAATLNPTAMGVKSAPELAGLAGSAVASEVASQNTLDNPVLNAIMQAIAPLVGGAAATGTSSLIAATGQGAKKALSAGLGVDKQAIKDLEAGGVEPTLAAVGGKGSKIIQNTLSEIPGSAGVIDRSAKETVSQIQKSVTDTARSMGSAKTMQQAGETLKKGAQGFIDRFNAQSDKLYSKLDEYIKPVDKVKVSNTQEFLNAKGGRFNDLPELKAVLNEPIVSKSITAFTNLSKPKEVFDPVMGMTSVVDDTVSYDSLKSLRSVIGKKLQTPNMDGDTRATLNQMYGSLSKDMEGAAQAHSPQAYNAFKRANAYYNAGSKRLESSVSSIIDAKTAQDAYKSAIRGTKDGNAELVKIKKSLKPEEFGDLQSAVITRLGKASAGKQDAKGEVFSPSQYVTRWNELSPEAKKVLFGGRDVGLIKKMDELAEANSRLKEVEKLANTSGTARVDNTARMIAGAALAPMSTLTVMLAGNATARLMAKPEFVKWLATGSKLKTKDQLARHIKTLSGIAATNPSVREDISNYISSINEGN